MVKVSKQEVDNFREPYIVAELGSNHNGDMALAKKMILAAKEAGADCVKFQSWSKETIFSKKVYQDNFFLNDDYRQRSDFTLEEIVEKYSISEEQLMGMKEYSDQIGIDLISTPFSNREVDFLVEIKAPFIKVASMDLNNYHFLDYVARKKMPIVLSTGLSELAEIDQAIKTIEQAGNDRIIILHCVSIYPPSDGNVNLNNMETLRQLYPYPVGYSDHTLGFSIALAATAKGACLIEKHFTLDKNLPGWDHKVSASPEELAIICRETKRINSSLGSYRIMCEEDQERKNAFRRSAVSARNLEKGERLVANDIIFKRPGTGVAPHELKYILGRKLKSAKKQDDLFAWEDFE